ncbi:MAG: 2-hydroxyacyl-CoA dehydratase subunit D [Candidatus Helarchaeota archaeon]
MNFDELEFVQASQTLNNSYIESWKKEDKKVMGFYCSNIPEELLHAVDLMPYRMKAIECKDTALADSILSHFNCSFARCSLNLALEGKFKFLDGLVIMNSCDHVRRLYDVWKRKVIDKNFPLLFISVPHLVNEHAQSWYDQEISLFIKNIENAFNVKLDLDKLKRTIEIYNKNREILRQIHKLRIQKEPIISASEFFQLLVANSSVPKEICNVELAKIQEMLKDRNEIKDYRARLMLVGSNVDNPDFLKIFEDVGGLIATDYLCISLKTIWDDVTLTGSNPMQSLLNRYFYKVSCPRIMNQHPERLEFIKEQVKSAKIDGVVLQRIEFCDLHGVDNMLLSKELEELDIPVLNIDREYLMGDVGRFKTRVEAFIEQILVS